MIIWNSRRSIVCFVAMRLVFHLLMLLTSFGGTMSVAPGQISVASEPTGFYRLDLSPGYQTVGISVVNPVVFGGWIGAAGGSTITAIDSSVAVVGLLDGGDAYYLEVVEGPGGIADAHVGQRFEVDVAAMQAAGTGGGVILVDLSSERTTWVSPASGSPGVPALAGYRFELRAHVTLGQIFDPFAVYGSANFADADQVQLFNGTGFTVYYVLGDNGSFAQWTRQSGGDFSPQDKLPIAPGQGLIYKRSASSPGALSLRVRGQARMTPFVQPMAQGFNFISEAFPASHSFDSREAKGGNFSNLDRVQVFNGTGFTTYRLYTDGQDNLWVNVLDDRFASQNSNPVFDFRRAVLVDLQQATAGYRFSPPYAAGQTN